MAVDPRVSNRGSLRENSKNVSPSGSNELTSEEYYKNKTPIEKPKGLDDVEDESGKPKEIKIDDAPRAMNPYYNLRVKTSDDFNYPLTDSEMGQSDNIRNITPKYLINNPRGASQYKTDDFLYVKNFRKIPLNRMITLRRFAFPVFDDIFSKETQSEPDIGRVIGYSDQETNKLSELLSFSAGMRWKDLKAASEQANMVGDQNGMDGMMGNVLKFVDPKFGREALQGRNRVNYDPQHDSNKVYGPIDSIDETVIRDVGLNFEQNMEITFEWEMRSINGVNQKSAFIDLLSNIILMTTNDGDFWGGSRYWVGPQPSKYRTNLKDLDPKNYDNFIERSTSAVKGFLKSGDESRDGKSTLENIAKNASNLALGKIMNKLGRPAIPMMNSLLTGTPVGMWHLTVGNPLNPILSAGDLIMENTNISFGDELGIDDFPTKIKMVTELKHAKPRDRGGIESIFNSGKGRTYLKPKDAFGNINMKKYFGDYNVKDIQKNEKSVWKFLKNNN